MGANAVLLLTLLTQLGSQVQAASALLSKANAEGRDVTAAELATLSASAQTAIDAAAKA